VRQRLRAALGSCWLQCRKTRRASEYSVFTLSAERVARWYLLARFMLAVCGSQSCQRAVSESLGRELEVPFDPISLSYVPDLLYSVIGLTMEGLVLLACGVVLLWMLAVWRVLRDAASYVVLTSMLFAAEAVMLIWWAFTTQTVIITDTAYKLISGFSSAVFVILFIIFLVMSLRWFFALFVLLGKEPPSPVAEQRITWIVYGLGLLFVVLSLVLRVANTILLGHGDNLLDFAQTGITFAMRFVILLLCLFMFGCSIAGCVIAKRSTVSADSFNGLVKMAIVTGTLAATVVFHFAYYVMTDGALLENASYSIPLWFDFLLVFSIAHAIQSLALLYLLASGARKFATARLDKAPDLEMISKPLLRDSGVPQSYEV
jgi:hypothetical protein